MGACTSKTPSPGTAAAPWPELPLDIAGLILDRLPSHEDRLSFAAVCNDCRRGARQQGLQPAAPYINLGHKGAYRSLVVDGKIRRFHTPEGYRAGASFGVWLFYYNEGTSRCFLRAPFSGGVSMEVPTRYQNSLVDFPTAIASAWRALPPHSVLIGEGMEMKMVVCSSDLVVALFRHRRHALFRYVSYVASFRPARLQKQLVVWSLDVQPHHYHHPAYVYTDIAFYRGKVLAVSCWEELFCHDLFDGDTDHQLVTVVYHDIDDRPTAPTNCYLVVSSDQKRLLMVRWRRNDRRAMDLWVFEACFGMFRWSEVKDLGDQVLFLGRSCSMAFMAGSTEYWGQKFRGGNRVFVLGTEWAQSSSGQPISYKDIPSYCVYDMSSGETTLVSLKGFRYTESCTPSWFFPMSGNL